MGIASSLLIYSYLFTAGLFYRTFAIYNDTEKSIYISIYASPRGGKNNKDSLLYLYDSAWDAQPYHLKNYKIESKKLISLGFNMDDEYPSWIEVKNEKKANIPVIISYEKPCAFIIKKSLGDHTSNKTNVKEDDISCMFADFVVSEGGES